MEELNKKLALWAGFVWHNYGVYDYEYKETRIEDPYWENPQGRKRTRLPDFPNDLNACFKWLVPKLGGYVIFTGKGGVHAIVVLDHWNNEAIAETPSLALCKAIEQVIDMETENGKG